MTIPTAVCNGLSETGISIGSIRVRPGEVGAACGKFSSTHILRMGLHYDRYMIANALPRFRAVLAVYSTGRLAAESTPKARANDVTGNIGESIAGLVARRKLGARVLMEVWPV